MPGTCRRSAIVAMVSLCALAANPAAVAPGIVELLNRYERGEFEAVARALADLPEPPRPWPVSGRVASERAFRDFSDHAPRWIDAAGPEAAPRRRLVAAVFALELAYARRTTTWSFRYPFIVWGCEQLRKAPTRLAAERWWHLSSIAILEDLNDWTHVLGERHAKPRPGFARRQFFSRADQLEYSEGHLTHARAAFPQEPRLLLTEAHYAEYLTFHRGLGPAGINAQQTSPALLESLDRLVSQRINWNPGEKTMDPGAARQILDRVNAIPGAAERYAELAKHDSLRPDAELRQGFLALRLEAWEQALAHLDAVPDSADAPLIALKHLFRGWVFEQTDRTAEAIGAYRHALAAAPLARSVSILLAAQLARTGQLQEAYAITDAALKASPAPDLGLISARSGPAAPLDPWVLYMKGDAVMVRTYLDRLREALR